MMFKDLSRRVRFQQHPTLTACWMWTGAFQNGYPRDSQTGLSARRCAYELIRGPLEDSVQLKASCGVRQCVNPHHMESGEVS